MLKSKLILMAVKAIMWLIAIGVGVWYLSSSINGDSITYASMDGFLRAAGACGPSAQGVPGEICDISQTNGCFLCPYIRQLFNVIGMASQDFWEALIGNLWILLALGFVVFLFFHTWKTMAQANTDNITMGSGARSFDFKKWFDAVWKQGARVLFVGVFLGAMELGGTAALKTVSDITIRPVMYVGSELAMAATNSVGGAHCPAMETEGGDNVIGPALNSFMCVVGNASLVILAGASGGFSLMNFSYIGMGGGLFTWMAGLGLVLMFLIIGFSLFFDILNVVFRLVFVIIFLPVIIAGYAYENVWGVLKGAVGKSVEILVNCAVRVVAIALKVIIIYSVVTYAADEYFPGPADGYSAIFPPGLAGMGTADDSRNQVVAQVFAKCERASAADGAMDKDLFKACFDREKAAAEISHPGAFDFMEDGWDFFMLMLGMFLLYFYVLSKKIDELLVGDGAGKDPIFNIGGTFKEFGTKLWGIPSGIAKKVTGAFAKK
jgi:hypothetical protein